MLRILLIDSDRPERALLADTLRRAVGTEVILANDADDALAKIASDPYAAVFADAEILGDQITGVVAAVATVPFRPLLVIASNVPQQDLDPDFVTLVVRKPYDVKMVTGILLAAVMQQLPGNESVDRARSAH